MVVQSVVPNDGDEDRHYTKGTNMAYVRTKRVGHREYYQLVESRRVDGKPRQTVLMHLGHHPDVDDALMAWPKEIRRLRRGGYEKAADELQVKLDRLRGMGTRDAS